MNNIILEISDLVTQFGDKVVHNHVNLKIKRGELLLLMGGSGSGKSTLVDFIMDTEKNPVYKGDIYWNGDHWDKSDIVYKIGFAPQNGGFLRDYTVGQNIAMPLEYVAQFPSELALEIAWATMQILGLGPQVFHQYPHTLSGGMLRRASIARALVLNQELLILDEPLSGLDPINCHRLINLIHDLVPEKTIICITHHFMTADRYAIMNKGNLLIGSLDEVRNDEFGREFMKGFPGE